MEASERIYPPRLPFRTAVFAGRFGFSLLILLLWQLFSVVFGAFWVSSPLFIAERLLALAASGNLFLHAYATLQESFFGFVVGAALGIGLPFLLRLLPTLAGILDPYLSAAMGVPKLALAPLLILWFGIDMLSKVVFVAVIVFFLFFFNTWSGIRSVDPGLVKVAQVLGAKQRHLSREIVWNTALPFIFAGAKIAMPRAISAAVVGEFIAADRGLGFYINDARGLFDSTGIFAGVIVVTIIIVLVNAGQNRLHRRLLSWRPREFDVDAF
ncbi:MAG: ABC transporter permease [Candidatus Tectomicrobia bacterium]|nr:ABC transporter permease [Candidatus Tectomicrobia bacterium]